jgi:hypothetical protein
MVLKPIFLKVWLTQRGLRFGVDCVDGHIAALLLAYLVQTRRLSAQQIAPLSAFQTLLCFIRDTDLQSVVLDFTKSEIDMRSQQMNSDADPSSREEGGSSSFEFPLQLHHPIIYPKTGESVSYNAGWRVGASSLAQLRQQATVSLAQLQRGADCFSDLFMRSVTFSDRHDEVFHVPVTADVMLEFLQVHTSLRNSSISSNAAASATTGRNAGEEDEFAAQMASDLQVALLQCGGESCVAGAVRGSALACWLAVRAARTVRRALGDRVSAVHTQVACLGTLDTLTGGAAGSHWPVEQQRHEQLSENGESQWMISIGISVNSQTVNRKVDRNDAAIASSGNITNNNFVESMPFALFWGAEKCQLRRFKDGAIVEAVVWEVPSAVVAGEGAVDVCGAVVTFSLGRHLPYLCGAMTGGASLLSAASARMAYHCDSKELFSAVELPAVASTSMKRKALSAQNLDQRSRSAIEAVDALRGLLTSRLTGLPLTVETLQAADPLLRYTAPFVPQPQALLAAGGFSGRTTALRERAGTTISLLTPPIRVFARMESSGKWPVSDSAAMRHSKTAMLLLMRSELMKQFSVQCVAHRDSLDVCYMGFVFRLHLIVGADAECAALSDMLPEVATTAADGSALPPVAITTAAQERRAALQRMVLCRYDAPALHHHCVKSLAAACPSYPAAVRLFGRWVAHHCLSGHIGGTLMELLVAYVYTSGLFGSAIADDGSHGGSSRNGMNQLPTRCRPASALAALLHTLRLLSTFSWDSEPLIVDFGAALMDDSSKESIVGGQQRPGDAISAATRLQIVERFRDMHSAAAAVGSAPPPMYVVSSADRVLGYHSALAMDGGGGMERVVLTICVEAARESVAALHASLQASTLGLNSIQQLARTAMCGGGRGTAVWSRFDCVLHFSRVLVNRIDPDRGPQFARLKVFTNLSAAETSPATLIVK